MGLKYTLNYLIFEHLVLVLMINQLKDLKYQLNQYENLNNNSNHTLLMAFFISKNLSA